MTNDRKCQRQALFYRRRRPIRTRARRAAALLTPPESKAGLLAALIDAWVSTQPSAWLPPRQVSQILIPCADGELVALRHLVHHAQSVERAANARGADFESTGIAGLRAWLRSNSGGVHRGYLLVMDDAAGLVGVVPVPRQGHEDAA